MPRGKVVRDLFAPLRELLKKIDDDYYGDKASDKPVTREFANKALAEAANRAALKLTPEQREAMIGMEYEDRMKILEPHGEDGHALEAILSDYFVDPDDFWETGGKL